MTEDFEEWNDEVEKEQYNSDADDVWTRANNLGFSDKDPVGRKIYKSLTRGDIMSTEKQIDTLEGLKDMHDMQQKAREDDRHLYGSTLSGKGTQYDKTLEAYAKGQMLPKSKEAIKEIASIISTESWW